jgi:hypothetical protein
VADGALGMALPSTSQSCSLPASGCQFAKLAQVMRLTTASGTRGSGLGLFYAWLPRRQAEVCCNPPSHSLSELPGPTTTGDRTLTTDERTKRTVTNV